MDMGNCLQTFQPRRLYKEVTSDTSAVGCFDNILAVWWPATTHSSTWVLGHTGTLMHNQAAPPWADQTHHLKALQSCPQECAAGRNGLQDYWIQAERFSMTAEGSGNYLWPFSVWLREITQLPPDLFLKGTTAAKWDLSTTLLLCLCVLYTLQTPSTGREEAAFF